MTPDQAPLTLADLQRAFDESFSLPRRGQVEERRGVLILRAGERRIAVEASRSGGLLRCPPLTPLPGSRAELVGLARVRGTLVAAFDLAALLSGAAPAPRSWAFLVAPDRRRCLLFDALERYAQVEPSALEGEGAWLKLEGELVEVVDLARLLSEDDGRSQGEG